MSEAVEVKSPLLNKAEAARVLRVAPITVHRMMKEGKLGFHRVGARVFTTQTFIDEFLQQNSRRPQAA